MPKTKRLIELIMTVNAKRRFTVKELAEEFGVSTRTMLRDLQELGEIGIPLYSEVGPHGGYRVLKNRVLPPIAFTENEAVALFFACQSLEFYSSLPFEAESASALKKFYHYLPEDTKQKIDAMKDRVLFWTPTRDRPSPYLQKLLDAAISQQVLSVEYDSARGKTKRNLLPLGLYAANGYWYCPAYCYLRKEIRLFRADRMLSVCVEKEKPPVNDFDQLTIHELLHPGSDPEHLVDLKVALTRKGVRRSQSEIWLEKAITVREDGSGWVDTQVDKREVDYFAGFFFGFGTDAKVIEPVEMVETIQQKIKHMANHYDETKDTCNLSAGASSTG
ncbi:MAG TPA: YafY family protein [Bacillales bacterium]|nr:YafY family protein [Bacillales bacterium]